VHRACSLTASFVDVLDQSVNCTHLCARHRDNVLVNVLVPALAKLAAQLVADLLIAAGPPAAALLIGHILRAHAHAQHVPDLEARCRLSLWRNDWQSRSSSSTRGSVRSLALRGRAARAVCTRTQQPMLTLAVRPAHTSRPAFSASVPGRRPGGAREQPFASKQGLILWTWGWRTAQGPYLGRVHARL